MRHVILGLVVGMLVVSVFCGCRAMSKRGDPPAGSPPTSSEPSAPSPAAGESKPPSTSPASTPLPETQTKPVNNKEISGIFILREALGQEILPLVDGTLLTLQSTTKKGANDPNVTLDNGKLELNQTLPGEGTGQGTVHAIGSFQKLSTTSGDSAIYVHPTMIDFIFSAAQIKSECYGMMTLTGKVRCTLNAAYTYGTHILSGTGQCMTHTNEVLDNLKLDIGNTTHKVRYALGFKVNGDPTNWKAYQWTGTAYVGGIKVDLTQLNNPKNTCNK